MTNATRRVFNLVIALCVINYTGGGQDQAKHQHVFDAISIHFSPPPDGTIRTRPRETGGPGTRDPGLFACANVSLTSLILKAYGIGRFQLDAPAWTDTARFDLMARIEGVATREQFKEMLRNALRDRFEMSTHTVERNTRLYELLVDHGGPLFNESDDSTSPDPTVRRPKFFTNRLSSRWVSMEELAQTVSASVSRPVRDGTGLGGWYDITLFWVESSHRIELDPGANVLPPRGPDIFEALRSQLGLRLESKQGQVRILVIDRIDKSPTPN